MGDIIKRPELASTLERLALAPDPVELFYNGDIADTLVKEIQQNGSIIDSLENRTLKTATPWINMIKI